MIGKQETLKETAENYAIHHFDSSFEDVDDHFIAGVKWQQERSYSKEEVREIIKLSCEEGMFIQRTMNDKVKIPYTRVKEFTIKIFEQFKKR